MRTMIFENKLVPLHLCAARRPLVVRLATVARFSSEIVVEDKQPAGMVYCERTRV